jgi:tRNA dimethylallyltransferase
MMIINKPVVIDEPVLVLIGPTAIGKTEFSFEICARFSCEIISMDSMQVYKYMDVGTAKPAKEELAQVPHHLIDIITPDKQYHAAYFVRDCIKAIRDITSRGNVPLITGGTGLYLSSLINGLFDNVKVEDEVRIGLQRQLNSKGLSFLHNELCRLDHVAGARIHANDKQRILRGLEIFHSTGIPWSTHLDRQKENPPAVRFKKILQAGLSCDRELLYKRIEYRSGIMLKGGLIEEVEKLRGMGYKPQSSPMQSIGYRHANQLIDGNWNREEMIGNLARDTRRYAKRQMTWFRRLPDINWYERAMRAKMIDDIDIFL